MNTLDRNIHPDLLPRWTGPALHRPNDSIRRPIGHHSLSPGYAASPVDLRLNADVIALDPSRKL